MNEVENEDLVFTLETIVDKFGEEMTPYALRLCQNLAAAFWRCMQSAEAKESLGQIFRVVLDLLVAYKEKIAEAAKDNEDDDSDDDFSDDEEFQSPIDNVDTLCSSVIP